MRALRTSLSCLILLLLLCPQSVLGQEDSTTVKNKYAPDLLRLQFAGNIGLVSAGASWLILNEKVEIGAAFGIVPRNAFSETIYITSLKAMYSPKWSKNYGRFSWDPISIGIVGGYHKGIDLSRYRKNEYYPENYYAWGVKTRLGLAFDTEVKMSLERGPFSDVSIYLESCIWDVYFFSVYHNDNDRYLGFSDLMVMGAGLKFFFRK